MNMQQANSLKLLYLLRAYLECFFLCFLVPTLKNSTSRTEKKTRPGKGDRSYLVDKPIELGSPEFERLMEEMHTREKIEDTALNTVIMPNKQILVLPCFSQGGQESQHSIVAKGNPCAWAGEVIIKGKKILKINDHSGHFRTFDYDEKVQKAISNFALQTFRDQGYDVPSEVELYRK